MNELPQDAETSPDQTSMNTSRADTATRILDVAERLFVEHGFEATSLRMITQQAEVNLAAVNYHFEIGRAHV